MNFASQALETETGQTLFRVILKEDSGRELIKTLTVDDYLSLLGSSIRHNLDYSSLPASFFPEGYIHGYIANPENYSMIWRHSARLHQMNHSVIGRHLIPFPELVFGLTIKDGYIRDARVFATKGGDDLYQYPFGNVSEAGHICMGNISVQGLNEGPQAFEDDFFAGVTNNDYFKPGSHVTLKCTQEALIKKLEGKDKFPDRYLKRGAQSSPHIMTVKDLVAYYKPR